MQYKNIMVKSQDIFVILMDPDVQGATPSGVLPFLTGVRHGAIIKASIYKGDSS